MIGVHVQLCILYCELCIVAYILCRAYYIVSLAYCSFCITVYIQLLGCRNCNKRLSLSLMHIEAHWSHGCNHGSKVAGTSVPRELRRLERRGRDAEGVEG